jgi:endoglucanase
VIHRRPPHATLFLLATALLLQGCRPPGKDKGSYLSSLSHTTSPHTTSSHPASDSSAATPNENYAISHGLAEPVHAKDTGYWHTSGRYILDQNNQPIRIQGINWYGLETRREVPGGLNLEDYRALLDLVRSRGFNTVRIPFSNEAIEHPIIPTQISYRRRLDSINSDLRGLNSLEILDQVIDYAGDIGLKVILDDHRSEAGDDAEQNGLWYTSEYPEAAWINDWKLLANRYRGNSTVIGMDLRNEPHTVNGQGACWACGGLNDWHLAAIRAGNAILAIEPRLLILVEGVDVYNNDYYWWGGNLQGVQSSPVQLSVPGRLVYSAHTYGPSNFHQPWFNSGTTVADLQARAIRNWGYIPLNGIAPVCIGEFGTSADASELLDTRPGTEGQWFHAIIDFLARNPHIGWTIWALNGEDAKGLLDQNYRLNPNDDARFQLLARIQTPIPPLNSPPPANAPATQPTPQTQVARQPPPPNPVPFAPITPQPAASSGSGSCSVSYRVVNNNGAETTVAVQIKNLSPQPINGWTLLWLYPGSQRVERVTNALFRQNQDLVILSNTQTNAVIPPKGNLSGITLQAATSGHDHPPQRFYLNGHQCF